MSEHFHNIANVRCKKGLVKHLINFSSEYSLTPSAFVVSSQARPPEKHNCHNGTAQTRSLPVGLCLMLPQPRMVMHSVPATWAEARCYFAETRCPLKTGERAFGRHSEGSGVIRAEA